MEKSNTASNSPQIWYVTFVRVTFYFSFTNLFILLSTFIHNLFQFYKSLLHVYKLVHGEVDPKYLSASEPYVRPKSTGEKTYGEIDEYVLTFYLFFLFFFFVFFSFCLSCRVLIAP